MKETMKKATKSCKPDSSRKNATTEDFKRDSSKKKATKNLTKEAPLIRWPMPSTICEFCYRDFLCVDTLYKHLPYCYHRKLSLKRKEGIGFGKDEEEDEELEFYKDEDDCKVSWLAGGRHEYVAWVYAGKAINHLNSQSEDVKYKLVRPGPFASEVICRGPIVHFNFKAKSSVSTDSPIETFFCQLRMPKSGDEIDVCVNLGPSHLLPSWRKANVQDCSYCRCSIHHPDPKCCEKLVRGNPEEDKWLYGGVPLGADSDTADSGVDTDPQGIADDIEDSSDS